MFPGTRLNIQCKQMNTSNTIGKTKETTTTKEVKTTTIKHHRENQTQQQQQKQHFQTHVHFGRHGSDSFVVVWCCLVFSMVFDSVCLDLFGCFGFFGFPDGCCYIFKCTLDSSKRLGRGCAPLLNKAFTLHEFPYLKGFLV